VVEEASGGWPSWLAFRDHLRAHPEDARACGALKRRLAEEHGGDPNQRDAYRVAKTPFVRGVLERLDQA
jgi:GrpB-like predicted nucleotidyltransferase (UPF0157 family)